MDTANPHQKLLNGLLGAAGPNHPMARQAALLGGHEDDLFLFGARDFPLAAMVARPLLGMARHLGVAPEDLEASGKVVVLLGTREGMPGEVKLRVVTEDAVAAIYSAVVATDSEEFFLPVEGETQNTLWRTVRVQMASPEAAFRAWEVNESSWAKTGFIRMVYGLKTDEEGIMSAEASPVSMALWGQRFQAGLGPVPAVLGCEALEITVAWVPEGSEHPLRGKALSEGLAQEGQNLLILIAQPTLGGLALESEGPHKNNINGGKLEALVASCNTPYSWACRGVALRALERGPDFSEVMTLQDMALGLLALLEPLIRGTWIGDDPEVHVPHLTPQLSQKLTEEIVGWVAKSPGQGIAVVGKVQDLRDQERRDVWIEGSGEGKGVPLLSLVELHDDDSLEKFPLLGVS